MKAVFNLLMVVLFSVAAFAGSTEGVGGGDPQAMEFLELATKFRRYCDQDGAFLSPNQIRQIKFSETKWRFSLNRNERSLIVVVEERPLDRFGVPKAATYNPENREIRLHRPTWSSYDKYLKLQLVVLELMGLAGVDSDRYDLALELVKENADKILEDY